MPDLRINEDKAQQYAHLTYVDGDLSIYASGITLSGLVAVTGHLYVHTEDVHLPALVYVGGYLVAPKGFEAPALAAVRSDCLIRGKLELASLKSIGGYLSVEAENVRLPSLTMVGGNLFVDRGGFAAPSLSKVDGDVNINAEGISLPALTTVGERLYVYPENVHLPGLTSVGDNMRIESQTFEAPSLTSVDGKPLPDPGIAHRLLVTIAQKVMEDPYLLDMGSWQSCIGGLAIKSAGDGRILEEKYGSLAAATHLLGLEGARLFFLGQEEALKALKTIALGEAS